MDRFWELRDYEKEKEIIIDAIKQIFEKSKRENAVIGLSGGIDSAITTALSSLALSGDRVYTFYLPLQLLSFLYQIYYIFFEIVFDSLYIVYYSLINFCYI